jgi:hypothetical protein
MTDQELKDLVASLAVNSAMRDAQIAITQAQMAKTDAQMAKTDAQMAKTDKKLAATSAKLDRIAAMVGGIANSQGAVAEEFFSNSLAAKPQIGGIVFDSVSPNLMFKSKREHSEFDIVLTNGKSVALIEVKYKAHAGDLDQALAKIESYRRWRPEHKDYSIFAGLASFSVPPDVIELAHERGIFVLQRKGDVLEIDAQQMRAM